MHRPQPQYKCPGANHGKAPYELPGLGHTPGDTAGQEVIVDKETAYHWLLKYGPKAVLEDVLRAEGLIPAAQSRSVRGSRC